MQRGVAQGAVDTGGSPTLTKINISSVNHAKCMLIIDNSVLSNVNEIAFGTYAVSFTSTSIGFYGNALVTARPSLVLVSVDYATGILGAIKTKKLDKSCRLLGIGKESINIFIGRNREYTGFTYIWF